MKHIGFSLLWVTLILMVIHSPAFSQTAEFVEGELIVQLNPGISINSLVERYEEIGLAAQEELWPELRLWLLTHDVGRVSSGEALELMQHDGDVSFVQFNHYVSARGTFPNDARFNEQWALHNTGQTGGTPDADIDAPEAWDLNTGGITATGDQIVIAVIDGGFALNHEDLSFFKNTHEIPGNGIDDDSNGYIDDYDGWNAYNMNGTIPVDAHGTHVAGIAAAKGNNGIGISGVNWGAKVMPIAGSSGTEAIVVRAYRYAWKMRQAYN